MKVHTTDFPGLLVLEPRVFGDQRGVFIETFEKRRYEQAGMKLDFVQDNYSRSVRGTLRGLHYQSQSAQGKLCWVPRGEVFDVAVDLRTSSPTFGKWLGTYLSEANRRQIYVPPGFAHGFCVISEIADFLYKCTDYYAPAHQHCIIWNDPDLNIDWPIKAPILSVKDREGLRFCDALHYA